MGKCDLRLYIRAFPRPSNTQHYRHCPEPMNSKLILGDSVGSVRVIDFHRNFKSQFRESPDKSHIVDWRRLAVCRAKADATE